MKSIVKSSLSLLLCLVLASLLSLSAFAEAREEPDDLLPYELPLGFYIDARSCYWVNVDGNALCSCTPDGDILWEEWGDYYVYVTEAGEKSIDALVNGTGVLGIYELLSDWNDTRAYIPDPVPYMQRLADLPSSGEIDVRELTDLSIIYISLYDETMTIATDIGALYFDEESGDMIYVDYTVLDNSHFDADGFLSYRSGKVGYSIVDPYLAEEILDALDSAPVNTMQYPDDMFEGEDIPEAVFWVLFITVGGVLPLAAAILGVVLANTGARKKRWYILTACAALAILACVAVTLLLTA